MHEIINECCIVFLLEKNIFIVIVIDKDGENTMCYECVFRPCISNFVGLILKPQPTQFDTGNKCIFVQWLPNSKKVMRF